MAEQELREMLKSSKSLLGMQVYSIQEGQNLGQVKNLVIDAKEKRLLAMVVEKRRLTKEEKLLPFGAVKSMGDDVVTVERGQSLERRGMDPAVMRALRRPVQPVGARCFTAGGKTMGKVEEYYLDARDGSIAQLEISDGSLFKGRVLVNGEHIIALAPHTVMLADEAISQCRPVESNLLSSMEVARDKAVSMLGNPLSLLKGGAKAEAPAAEEATEEAAEAETAEIAETVEVAEAAEVIEIEVTAAEAEEIIAAEVAETVEVEILMPEEAPDSGRSVNETSQFTGPRPSEEEDE